MRLSGLARLLTTAGWTVTPPKGSDDDADPTLTPPAGEGEPIEGDEDEEEQQGGEGQGAGGEGGSDDDDAGSEGGDGGEGAGGEGGDPPQAVARSSDYRAGEAAANARWAAVFSQRACRDNLTLALDLLSEPQMSAQAIIRTCTNHSGSAAGGTQQMRNRLRTTANPDTRITAGQGTEGEQDEGRTARSKAAERQNARIGARAKQTGARVNRREGEQVETK